MLAFFKKHLSLFCCPVCQSDLKINNKKQLQCSKNHSFKIQNNLPLLFVPDKLSKSVTKKIKNFYEHTPFPNYDNLDTPADLIQKSKKGGFARKLDEQIPFNLNILEVGCGTGQLSNFLSLANRHLFGVDMSINSLSLANQFKLKHDLNRVSFCQMNLFKPCFKPQSFPLVICTGVLHHTHDPFKAFQSISNLVKPGGYLIFGLYHRYGRIITHIRRIIFKLTNNRFQFLDPLLKKKTSKSQYQAWFKDQYYNPHESGHTFLQSLDWLKKTKLEFVSSLPQLKAFSPVMPDELFKPTQPGSWFDRLFANLKLISSCSREGGLFIIIARKPK